MFAYEDQFFLRDFRNWVQLEEEKFVNHLVGTPLDHAEYSRTVGQIQALRAAKQEFERLISKHYPD